ncbi:MAG: tRNA 2-thiouridine(34) synthase MnmA [Armatimonadetes bacterium]|nr:tRNA 2-thiouridine(34) synthase MnmA [Armatimonadota bacterium]
MKIAVAMSGGVDSSVAAAILLKEGHEVIGVTMRHFDNAEFGFGNNEGSELAIQDAKQVCGQLDIKHYVLDITEEFKSIVIADFIKEYSSGRTPNPCTLCNPTIKWGVFLKKVLKLGVQKIATGHYVRLHFENKIFNLYKSKDEDRDQTYMLWGLNQQQLSQTLFPVAEYTKKEIRKIANKLELPVHDKEDSQEICFIKGHYEDYLKDHIEFKSGNIIYIDGKTIGKHKGLPLYTIGQRKGLNTPWHSALYVLKPDVKNNTVVVTDNPDDLLCDRFSINQINCISGSFPEDMKNLSVQIRYNSKSIPVQSMVSKNNEIQVNLISPTRAITPGQSAVFYKGNLLLGGGIIV